jgi:DNA-binding response OmpR family regulator
MPSINVLIVDDDPRVALTLAASLESLGPDFAVDTAYGFTEAFAKAERNHYTLLIVDYQMPGLNGLDLARAVQGVSPATRIVLMSAYGTPELRETAQFLGLVGYLDKPFTIAQLRETVRRTTGKPTTERRVLLLEEVHNLRRLYGNALRAAGYRVHEATTLDEAHDLLAIRRFDLFICALDLSGENVMDFVRAQRDKFAQAGTQVIAISAEGGHRSNWEEMGVDFYLETPVATDPLVTLADRLTAKRSGRARFNPDG